MADACMPEKFYELVRPMLPAEKEIGPAGGRPPKRHHTVLKVIWFVLVTSCRWKDVPKRWAAVAKPRALDCKTGNVPAFGSNCTNCC